MCIRDRPPPALQRRPRILWKDSPTGWELGRALPTVQASDAFKSATRLCDQISKSVIRSSPMPGQQRLGPDELMRMAMAYRVLAGYEDHRLPPPSSETNRS
eukprot:6313685-Alexandrium_andersonii.AAC.1